MSQVIGHLGQVAGLALQKGAGGMAQGVEPLKPNAGGTAGAGQPFAGAKARAEGEYVSQWPVASSLWSLP